jgi:hypothetical protein
LLPARRRRLGCPEIQLPEIEEESEVRRIPEAPEIRRELESLEGSFEI